MVVKKYSTRRLYDTELSRYVKLEDLAAAVRAGKPLQVVDAQTGEDLTQGVLVQLLTDRQAIAKLPSEVLHRLLGLDEERLAEFFGRRVGAALAAYEQELAGRGPMPRRLTPVPAPPAAATDLSPDEWGPEDGTDVGSRVRPRADASADDQVAALRREVEELKDLIRGVAKRDSA